MEEWMERTMGVQHTARARTKADGSGTRAEASSWDNGAVVPSARTFTGSMAACRTRQKVPVMAMMTCASEYNACKLRVRKLNDHGEL